MRFTTDDTMIEPTDERITERNGGAAPVQCSAVSVQCSATSHQRSRHAGFSLIELIIVVSIIGLLAAVAVVNVRYAQRKAREAALMDNLFTMRKAIDTFYADKQRYPTDLNELVPGYMRKVPADPITGQADWEAIMDDPLSPEGEMSANPDPDAFQEPGIVDVRSTAEGSTLDGVAYREL